MWKIPDNQRVEDGRHEITTDFETLMYYDMPIEFSGKNKHGERVVAFVMDNDYNIHLTRYCHFVITVKQYSDYLNGVVSLMHVLSLASSIFIVDVTEAGTAVFKVSFDGIPGDFLPSDKESFMQKTRTLKFDASLAVMVGNGEKTISWRIDDEKDIGVGNFLSLRNKDMTLIGQTVVLWTRMTTFGSLTDEDRDGHEKFASDDEMYRTYSGYYNIEVMPETPVKVIKWAYPFYEAKGGPGGAT